MKGSGMEEQYFRKFSDAQRWVHAHWPARLQVGTTKQRVLVHGAFIRDLDKVFDITHWCDPTVQTPPEIDGVKVFDPDALFGPSCRYKATPKYANGLSYDEWIDTP